MSPFSPPGILLTLALAVAFGVLGAAAYRGRWTSWQAWTLAGRSLSAFGLPWWSASAALTGLAVLGDSVLPPALLKLMSVLAMGTWIIGAALLLHTPDRLLPQWLRTERATEPADSAAPAPAPAANAGSDHTPEENSADDQENTGREGAPAADPAETTEHPWRASGAPGTRRGRTTT